MKTIKVLSSTITDDVYDLADYDDYAFLRGEMVDNEDDYVYFLIPEDCTDYTSVDYSIGYIQYYHDGIRSTRRVKVELVD